MNRRYRAGRRSGSFGLPTATAAVIGTALLLWLIWAKGESIIRYFEGETIYYADNSVANANLERLLADLSGNKAQLLSLAQESNTRLGWIKDGETRRRVRWILMYRLLDNDLWNEAVRILPEVEDLSSLPSLERLALAAQQHENFELQLHLDNKLQDAVIAGQGDTEMLLRSIRRTAETCIKMHDNDGAVKVISRLDAPTVLARLSTPALAAEAADLQMLRADVSTVKEHPLQLVRNILEQAKWPPCRATSRLMLEEVTSAFAEDMSFDRASLNEIEKKMLHCRDALLEYSDKEHKLPQCYLILGELRFRMEDYDGCVQALTLANAFAEGYGESDVNWQLRVVRLRAKANMARKAKGQALEDCRFLAEHETSLESLLPALTYLSTNCESKERESYLSRLWAVMQNQPNSTKASKEERARIAKDIFQLYAESGSLNDAVKWGEAALKAAQAAFPNMSDGRVLRTGLQLALMQRKKGEDSRALKQLRDIVRTIEEMDEATRENLDRADKELYKEAVREYARTCLFTGDRDTAKTLVRKIKETLPAKQR